MGKDYLHLFIKIEGDTISEIKYLCTCDPTANVVFEILCSLTTGKTIAEVSALTEESFVTALNSRGKDFLKRAKGSLELINRGISRYKAENATIKQS
jgi:NifU-like protein involved in Fe-S cluster formation